MRKFGIPNGFGSRVSPRDHQIHTNERDILTREKYMKYQFDQDPQGMGMPFKNFIVRDNSRDMGEVKGRQVVYEFPNGYGASVVMGELFHTDETHPYEVGPLYKGKLDYTALGGDMNDVLGFQDDADLMIVLSKLMALPKEKA